MAWVSVAALLIIGFALQQYLTRSTGTNGNPNASPRPMVITVNTDAAGWKEYSNTKNGFTVKYPANANLRGLADSDYAIIELDKAVTGGKQAMVTMAKKNTPLGAAPYASMDEFWNQEKDMLVANGGVVVSTQNTILNGRTFFEAREDNKQNNYTGLHRYIMNDHGVFELALTIEGDKIDSKTIDLYNRMASTFEMK